MSSSEVEAPTSDSSVTEEVKEASAESATKPAKDDNSSEASPKKVSYRFGKVDSFGELTRLNRSIFKMLQASFFYIHSAKIKHLHN